MLAALIPGVLQVAAQPQIQVIEDNQGNNFDLTGLGEENGTYVYGTGTEIDGRYTDHLEIKNNTDFEVCIREHEENLRYAAWLGSTGGFHPTNIPVDNKTSDNCFNWKVNDSHVKENMLRFNIWSRDQDENFEHYNGSESDLFVGLRYENVKVVEKEKVSERS